MKVSGNKFQSSIEYEQNTVEMESMLVPLLLYFHKH
jgi:hypothetical protein